MLIGQIVTSHAWGFPLLLCKSRGKSGNARLERLVMIYGDYIKKEWVVFIIIGWLFTHSGHTSVFKPLIKVNFA